MSLGLDYCSDQSRVILSQLPSSDTRDLAFGFTDRQIAFYEGDVLTSFGDHELGDEVLRRALTMYRSSANKAHTDETLVLLDLAMCRLQAGDPEAAAKQGTEAIWELPIEHRPDLIIRRARQIAVAIASSHHGIARLGDFSDAIDTTAAISLAHL